MSEVPDLQTREEISTSLDKSFVVMAGAGSGKTQVLVDRIVCALVDGATEPEELVAITFTEAAASEMKERVRERLVELVERSDASDTQGTRAKEVLSSLDAAKISTIHSFAQSILAEFPLQAGVPVGFRVQDPSVYVANAVERWNDYFSRFFSTEEGKILSTVLSALGYDVAASLPGLVTGFMSNCAPLILPARLGFSNQGPKTGNEWPADSIWESKKESLIPDITELVHSKRFSHSASLLEQSCFAEESGRAASLALRCCRLVARIKSALSEPLSADSWYSITADLVALEKVAKKLQSATASQRKTQQGFTAADAAQHFGDDVREVLKEIRRHCASSILALMAHFAAEEARRRRRAGELTYEDLLTVALELVELRPDIRERLASRYKCYLIDEFQDTDAIQVLLVFSLLGLCWESSSDEKEIDRCNFSHRHQRDPHDGRLVIVGDIKQSIYAFRGAEPKVLRQIAGRWEPIVRNLETNFRSRPEIVEFVNALFSQAFYSRNEEDSVSFEPLRAARTLRPVKPPRSRASGVSKTLPRVTIIGGPRSESAETVRMEEMSHIAALIREATGADSDGGWLIETTTPRGESLVRTPCYKDIAVLIRGRTWLSALESVFEEAGIPYRLETGELLYATQEAHDICAVLSCLDDPLDAISVVAALKSAIFACSDRDLLEYYIASGADEQCWQYTSNTEGLGSEGSSSSAHENTDNVKSGAAYVASCMAALRSLYEASRSMPLHRLIERIVRQCKLLEGALIDPPHRERWRRFRFLVDDARKFVEEGRGLIREYLKWASLMREGGSKIAVNIGTEPDENAVRVLTIHGSKGLEFPIVFAVGALGQRGTGRRDSVLVGSDGSVEVKLGAKILGIQTAGYERLAEDKSRQARQEEIRLSYVAMTRARDYLVVSRYGRAAKADNSLDDPVGMALQRMISSVRLDDDHAEETEIFSRSESFADPLEVDFGWGVLRWEPRAQVEEEALPKAKDATSSANETQKNAREHQSSSISRPSLALQKLSALDEGIGLRPAVFSATEIAKLLAGYDFGRSSSNTKYSSAETVDSLAVGKAVHEVLAKLDFANDVTSLERTVSSLATEVLGVTEKQEVPLDLVVDLCKNALKLPTPKLAASHRHYKELYMCCRIDEWSAIEGFADLVLELDDGLAIADYKTDSLLQATDQDLLVRHYSYQLAAYALALGLATGRDVQKCLLLFLGDPEPLEVEIEGMKKLIGEIEQCVRDLSSRRNRNLELVRND